MQLSGEQRQSRSRPVWFKVCKALTGYKAFDKRCGAVLFIRYALDCWCTSKRPGAATHAEANIRETLERERSGECVERDGTPEKEGREERRTQIRKARTNLGRVETRRLAPVCEKRQPHARTSRRTENGKPRTHQEAEKEGNAENRMRKMREGETGGEKECDTEGGKES